MIDWFFDTRLGTCVGIILLPVIAPIALVVWFISSAVAGENIFKVIHK